MVAVADLKPWGQNPRRNDLAVVEVVKSIERFGFSAPIVANRRTGEIIAGHTRWLAAQRLKLAEVPVRWLDLSAVEQKALALADNRLAEIATWDAHGLAEVIQTLAAEDAALLGSTGFSDSELAELLKIASDDEQPLPEAKAVEVHSRSGEVYELGPHRLLCVDVRAEDTAGAVVAAVGGRRVQVAVTSPPYASQREYDSELSEFEPVPADGYVDWFEAVQATVAAVLAGDGSWLVNIKEHCEGGQRHLYVKDLTVAHVRRWGWSFVDEYAWVHGGTPRAVRVRFKNGWEPVLHFVRGGLQFHPDNVSNFDPVFHFAKGVAKFRPGNVVERAPATAAVDCGGQQTSSEKLQGSKQRGSNASLQGSSAGGKAMHDAIVAAGVVRVYPSNVLSPGRNREALGHPAAYPVSLPEFFVRAYSDRGDVVFDPFTGSGSTLIAAAKHGRVFVGAEISPRYCDVIRRRWTAWATAQKLEVGSGGLAG